MIVILVGERYKAPSGQTWTVAKIQNGQAVVVPEEYTYYDSAHVDGQIELSLQQFVRLGWNRLTDAHRDSVEGREQV